MYPTEINERRGPRYRRAYVAYLGKPAIAVSRDMRLLVAVARRRRSSTAPSRVPSRRLRDVATDMMYLRRRDATASTAVRRSPRRTILKQYNGIKMVRREAFPLSGEAGVGEIGEMVAGGTIATPPSARNAVEQASSWTTTWVTSWVPSTRRTSSHSTSSSTPAAGWREWSRRGSSNGVAVQDDEFCFTVDGTFPNHEANPLIEENRVDITERVITDKADIGIAWDGDADRCFFIDGTGEFISGDFVTALLAEAALIR